MPDNPFLRPAAPGTAPGSPFVRPVAPEPAAPPAAMPFAVSSGFVAPRDWAQMTEEDRVIATNRAYRRAEQTPPPADLPPGIDPRDWATMTPEEKAIATPRAEERVRQTDMVTPFVPHEVDWRAAAGEAAQMGGFSLSDEFAGLMGGAESLLRGRGFMPGYRSESRAVRDQLARYRKERPGEAFAAGAVGSLPTAMLGLPVRAASLGAQALRGGVLGATEMGAHALGAAEGNPLERVRQVVTSPAGLFVGGAGVAGAGLPVLARGIGMGVRRLARWGSKFLGPAGYSARNFAANQVRQAEGLEPNAMRRLTDNPALTGADVDPTLRTMTMGAVLDPGAAQRTGRALADARHANYPQMIQQHFDASLGGAPDVRQLLENYQNTVRANANRNFGAALAAAGPHIDPSPLVQQLDNEIARINRVGIQDSVVARQLRDFRDMFDVPGGLVTDPALLHRIQTQMRTRADDLMRPQNSAEEIIAGRRLNDLRQGLIQLIDQPTGGLYRTAQAAYRTDSQIDEAFQRGWTALRASATDPEVRPEYLAHWMLTATPDEIQAARLGVRAKIDTDINLARNEVRRGIAVPDVPFNLEKLRILFGPDEAETIAARMADANTMLRTDADLFANSMTAPRGAARDMMRPQQVTGINMGDLGAPAAGGYLSVLAGGQPSTGVATGIGASLATRALQGVKGRQDRRRNAYLVSRLYGPSSVERDAFMAELANPALRQQRGYEIDRVVGSGLGAAARTVAPPAHQWHGYHTGRRF